MGLLTKKYNAWAKHPEKYTAKQVLEQIVADLKWLDEEELKNCTIPVVSNSVICCPKCGNERLESTGVGWYICADRRCDWGGKL